MSTASAGMLVGSWEILEPIGRGGQATVHRARHATLGRPAAVKIVHRDVWDDPAFRVRFQRECDALAAIEHPHVIPVYDAGDAGGRGYLAMRLAASGSLADALGGGPPAPARGLALVRAVAAAVDAVHATGRVHRDVTPANILLDPAGGPWLGDFGLSRRIDATMATQDGLLVGTVGYLAPEVIAGGRAGPEADRYALAAVAYHVLTGRAPFAAPDLAGVLYGHMHLSPPPVARLRPGLPAALDDAFARCLSRRPAERPPTAAAVAEAIAAALGAAPAGSGAPGPPPDERAVTAALPAPRRRRRRGTVAAALVGGVTLLVGIGGGVAYTQRDALPFVSQAPAEPMRVTTVPGAGGIDVPARPATADDLPEGVAATPGAVAADVGDVRVLSLPGGASAAEGVRVALEADGMRTSTAEYEGRPIGLELASPWRFFIGGDSYGLMVVREPAGERALVIRGGAGDVRDHMDDLAVSIGARILATS